MNPTREPCRPSVTHRYAVSHRRAGSFCVDSFQLSRGRGCGCPGCAADPTGSFALPTRHPPSEESQLSDDEGGVQCPGAVRMRPHCRMVQCGHLMPDRGPSHCGHRFCWFRHRGDHPRPMILYPRICSRAGIGGHRVRRFPCVLCDDVASVARGPRLLERGGSGAACLRLSRAVLRPGVLPPRVTRE